jgi:hypothetical protein
MGDVVAGTGDGEVLRLSARDGKMVERWQATGPIREITLSPDGESLTTVAVYENDEICRWRYGKREPIHRKVLAFSLIASDAEPTVGLDLVAYQRRGDPSPIELHDLTRWRRIGSLSDDNTYRQLRFSPHDLYLAAGSYHGDVTLWDIRGRRHLRSWRMKDEQPVEALAFSCDSRLLAAGGYDGMVYVWETLTGKELLCWSASKVGIHALAFNADGRYLATGGDDQTIAVWDLPTFVGAKAGGGVKATSATLTRCYEELASAEPLRGYRAIWTLASYSDEAVLFLASRLRPFAPRRSLAALLQDLDSDAFRTREEAFTALKQHVDQARPFLSERLSKPCSPEVRSRLRMLLEGGSPLVTSPKLICQARALQVLQAIGTTQARKLLEQIATGDPNAWVTQQAHFTLQLPKRTRKSP